MKIEMFGQYSGWVSFDGGRIARLPDLQFMLSSQGGQQLAIICYGQIQAIVLMGFVFPQKLRCSNVPLL